MGRKKKSEVVEKPTLVPTKLDISPEELAKYSEQDLTPIKQGREFKFEKLSASMLKVWLRCKRQFHKQYVEGIKSDANTSFSLGIACHFALEQANLSLLKDPRPLSDEEVDAYVNTFINMASTLHVTSMELFDTGSALVRDELSYFAPGERVIGVEQQFDIVTPEGVRIYGFIDKVTEVDGNTIKITDYKTSNMPMTHEEARLDEQLSMYDLAVRIMYPQYDKRILELRYLKEEDPDKKSVKSWRSDIESANFRKQILGVSNAIKDYIANLNEKKDAPNGEMNEFCNWCSYRQSCPQYVQAANTLLPDAPSSLELTDADFVQKYEKVQGILKAAEAWKDLLKTWAIRRLEEDPETPISDGRRTAYSLSTTRREVDVEGLLKLFSPAELAGSKTGKPLVKAASTNIQEYLKLKGDSKLEKKVEDLISIKFNAPQIRMKKEKER